MCKRNLRCWLFLPKTALSFLSIALLETLFLGHIGRRHRPPVTDKRKPKERYPIATSAISKGRGGLQR
jgi:hypothetical protein